MLHKMLTVLFSEPATYIFYPRTPSIVDSRTVTVELIVAISTSVAGSNAGQGASPGPSHIAPDSSTFLFAVTVVSRRGHVPYTISSLPSPEFAAPLAGVVAASGACNISLGAHSWGRQVWEAQSHGY